MFLNHVQRFILLKHWFFYMYRVFKQQDENFAKSYLWPMCMKMLKMKFPEFLRLVNLWGIPQIWIFAPWVLSTVHQSGFLKWPISLIRSGKKQSISNFSLFFYKTLWKFHKTLWKTHKNSLVMFFSPLLVRKEDIWVISRIQFGAQWTLSLIHIWRCRRIERCRSRWSPYH